MTTIAIMLSRASLLRKNPSAVSRCRHYPDVLRSFSIVSTESILRPLSTHHHAIAVRSGTFKLAQSSSPLNEFQRRTFAGRKDRHSTAFETRPPTKKQRKAYHRRQRKLQYEVDKHSIPNSKARERRAEEREHNERLIEIAKEEEHLKGELGQYFDKIRDIQAKIESTDKFQALLQDGKVDRKEIEKAAREAAKKAAAKEGIHHPPLPSWIQDRMTYDWGDALIDDLMGNSADLTSSPSPFPVFMGGEYGRLRRKVERILRLQQEERLLLDDRRVGMNELEGDRTAQALLSTSTLSVSERKQPPNSQQNNNMLSDKLISDLIRSHRDANGKRTTPIGLAASLQLLFQDLNIPRSEIGVQSYVSLLTVCKNPWEARKLNEMRKSDGVQSNEYFWSALVDVYARSGDYLGAEHVLDEMLEETKKEYEQQMSDYMNHKNANREKIPKPIAIPPLPAYTSFFSSCYKLIARPDVHPSIKADAAKRAWNRWKEMRICSVPPDAMAYGAMMRIYAAQGRAEKAVDLLEEIMAQMMMPVSAENVLNRKGIQEEILRSEEGDGDGWYDDRDGKTVRVKPTTLLFTSALKSVAKSHEIACRFSGGQSRKNKRRESIAAYHGKLARKIVILAEQAEVEQDDGFVSALMLCAAAAGDSSTARAIYLASKVRRLDHLRTCGGKDHLKRLQGLIPEEERLSIGHGHTGLTFLRDGKVPALRTIEEELVDNHKAYENREYGTDTRILTTLLLAHAKAMEPKGLGSMWTGKYNRGYLCENSLRWIEAYNQPKMQNLSIPGITSVDAGLTAEGWEPEDFDEDSKQLRKKSKFRMQQIADDGEGNRRDDMDPFFDGYDPDPDDVGDDHVPQLDGGNDNRDWLSQLRGENHAQELLYNSEVTTLEYRIDPSSSMDDDNENNRSDDDEDYAAYHDKEDFLENMTLDEKLAKLRHEPGLAEEDEEFNKLFEETMRRMSEAKEEPNQEDDDLDGYIDEDEFNRLMEDTMRGMDDSDEDDEALDNIPGVATNNYAAFRAHLEAELREEGKHDVHEEEAQQLFAMMRTYYTDSSTIPNADFSQSGKDNTYTSSFSNEEKREDAIDGRSQSVHARANGGPDSEVNIPIGELVQPQMTKRAPTGMPTTMMYADDFLQMVGSNVVSQPNSSTNAPPLVVEDVPVDSRVVKTTPMETVSQRERNLALNTEDPHMTELKQLLPGLPMNRIEKILDEFAAVLGYPSVLRLALVLRENMPDELSPQCLIRKNLANAQFLFTQASTNNVVDIHLLNAMLHVQTNSGRIDPAIRFHEREFRNHKMSPTTHSDRLIIDMLIKKKRIDRAFKLKNKIEDEGRTLDLLSYGSLVEHFGKQQQLGSALLMIKECISIHGSPPGEKSLKHVREICRKHGLENKVGLVEMIGEDPLEWLRKGKKHQKSRSRRGNSQVMFANNRMLDI